ncbi:helix-turn-helix transcriptional regulator [Vallitalea sediminicola]
MSRTGVSLSKVTEELMKAEEFRNEYEKLKIRYEIISEIIKERKEQNITQEELAFRTGTQKSNISRLESGNYNPSLNFLFKVAKGLGKEIHIILK